MRGCRPQRRSTRPDGAAPQNRRDRRSRLLLIAIGVAIIVGGLATFVWRTIEPNPTSAQAVEANAVSQAQVDSWATRSEPAVEAVDGQPRPLWRTVDEGALSATPEYPAGWSEAGRVLVDVSSAVAYADFWRVGDRLKIPLPQIGESYEARIERIVQGPGVSRSVRGFARDADDRERLFVVTIGPTRVLAYVDTKRGPYELVADTRLGWLAPTSSLLAGFDFSKPDYLIPDRREPDRVRP